MYSKIWGDIMSSRMDKYTNEDNNGTLSRTSKNQKMYDELYTSTSFTEFTDVDNNFMEISSNTNVSKKREDYQKVRNFSEVLDNDLDKKSVHEKYSYEFIEPSLKNYDINSVLEEAKKNRNDDDSLEKKRKLRTIEEYDILSDLTQEKIKSYKEKKREVISEEEEVQLQDLIDAVTANFPIITEDDESGLFDDLMPSKLDETIVSSELGDELNGLASLEVTFEHTVKINDDNEDDKEENQDEEKVKEEKENDSFENEINVEDSSFDDTNTDYDFDTTSTELTELDDSFYSKSMDFSDDDLMDTDENEVVSDVKKKKTKNSNSKVLIILLILVLLAIFGVIIYSVITGVI